jgi:hypothetical protein
MKDYDDEDFYENLLHEQFVDNVIRIAATLCLAGCVGVMLFVIFG